MSLIVQWFYLLGICLWVGSIFFFSFVTTPAIFASLPKEMGSQFLSVIFPRYYVVNYIAGGLVLMMSLLESVLIRSIPWIRLVLILIMLASSLYAGLILRPQLHQLKVEMQTVEEATPAGQKMKKRFSSGHRNSVILNLIVLVGGLFLLGILAFRLRL